jgi:hypothetical protein
MTQKLVYFSFMFLLSVTFDEELVITFSIREIRFQFYF